MYFDIPEGQMDEITAAIVLPDAWVDPMLAQVYLSGEVNRVGEERQTVQ